MCLVSRAMECHRTSELEEFGEALELNHRRVSEAEMGRVWHSRQREQHMPRLRGTKGPGMSVDKLNVRCGCGVIWVCVCVGIKIGLEKCPKHMLYF